MVYNIDNTYNDEGPPSLKGLVSDCSPESLCKIDRLASICGLATYLRNFPTSILSDQERNGFTDILSFAIELESKCFDEMGFQ